MRILLPLSPMAAWAAGASVEARAGWAGFIDDFTEHHFVAGGSASLHAGRFFIGPEFQRYQAVGHNDVTAQVRFGVEFRRQSRVSPYVLGYWGVLRMNTPRFSVNGPTYGAGVGAKVFLNRNWYMAPELRVGLQPFTVVSVGVGYVWRR